MLFRSVSQSRYVTRPTVGPLFGAYKLQHFIFTIPIRLYNSWLHNNKTGIGLKISDIKLPILVTSLQSAGKKYNQSSLMAYLGMRGYLKSGTTRQTLCQAVPILGYLDIFKNYFANTQEDNFYMVTGLTTKPNKIGIKDQKTYTIPGRSEFVYHTPVGNPVIELTSTEGTLSKPTSWYSVWARILIKVKTVDNETWENATKYTSNANSNTITLDKLGNGAIGGFQVSQEALSFFESSYTNLTSHPLKHIDLIRETILATKGNSALNINEQSEEKGLIVCSNIYNARYANLGGLLLKTYDSDIFQNWIKTDWIDGENGISAISAVAVQDPIVTGKQIGRAHV